MVKPLRHRQTKGAANRYARPTATAPHSYSTHSGRSRGLLLASDDAKSATYPTVDKGSGNLGTPPALQRVQRAHGEATAAGETCGDRQVGGSGRPGDPNTR